MKKFMKGCAITALILVVVGMCLGAVAGTVRGRTAIEETLEAITGGRMHLHLSSIGDWGLTAGEEFYDQITGDGYYNLEDSMVFNEFYDVLEGDVERYSLGDSVRDLDVEVGGYAFYIERSHNSDFYLEAQNVKKLQSYVKDGTLHIVAARNGRLWEEGKKSDIILYVPEDFHFQKAELEIGAGLMDLGTLSADKVSLEVGAGQIVADQIKSQKLDMNAGMGEILVDDMQVQELDAEAGMGHIYVAGAVGTKANVECSMGSVEMDLAGREDDYNYDIECGMGSIVIGSDSYTGLAHEKYIDNNAGALIDLECSMGNIVISYDW